MSRLSFRPRPLDINKKLPIVKSVKDLDSDEGAGVSRTVQHGHIALDAENELVLATPTRRGGGSEIPTPNFEVVDSYETDYTRTFHQPASYLRGRGARNEGTDYVEYDLDDEDEDWLLQLNAERRILSPERFETMLYNLELLDHKCRERTGGMPITQGMQMPVLLHRDTAFEALRSQTSRQAVLGAVFEYWKAKRDRWQKPILRRMQPPPPVNDTNPFNVFRPREKVHRPHTRRMQRRENDISSFEKLRQVRRNLEQSRNLMLALHKREEKKRELVECDLSVQRLQIKLKHDSRIDDDGLTATTATIFANRKLPPSIKKVEEGLISNWSSIAAGNSAEQINGNGSTLRPALELSTPVIDGAVDLLSKQRKKRRRVPLPRTRPIRRMKASDSLDPVLLFTEALDPEKLAAAGILPPVLEPSPENGLTAPFRLHGRFGRGGRILFDRWDPLNCRPLVPFEPAVPLTSPFLVRPAEGRCQPPQPPKPPKPELDASPMLNLDSTSLPFSELVAKTPSA